MAVPNFLKPLQPMALRVAAAAARAGTPAATASLTGFTVQTQLQTQWCWAAVSTSVAVFYGSTQWTQCLVASAELRPLDCCGADASNGCNQPWSLDTALTTVGHFGRFVSSSSSFAVVQGEINADRPLGCRIQWADDDGAHFVALGGWSTGVDGTEYVDVHDPYYGFVQKTYDGFVSSYRKSGDTWTHSYFTLATPPPVASGGAVPRVRSPISA